VTQQPIEPQDAKPAKSTPVLEEELTLKPLDQEVIKPERTKRVTIGEARRALALLNEIEDLDNDSQTEKLLASGIEFSQFLIDALEKHKLVEAVSRRDYVFYSEAKEKLEQITPKYEKAAQETEEALEFLTTRRIEFLKDGRIDANEAQILARVKAHHTHWKEIFFDLWPSFETFKDRAGLIADYVGVGEAGALKITAKGRAFLQKRSK